MERMSFDQFSTKYCERQESTPVNLHRTLEGQRRRFNPDGWMLLECQMLNSSHLGELTILPYGQSNTYKEIPNHPISPRGLASDMSVVVAYLPIELFPLE